MSLPLTVVPDVPDPLVGLGQGQGQEGQEGHLTLVPDVPDALVERDAGAVVDRLERDGSVRGLGHVADDVEGRQHRVLVVGLARERAGVRVRRRRRRRRRRVGGRRRQRRRGGGGSEQHGEHHGRTT